MHCDGVVECFLLHKLYEKFQQELLALQNAPGLNAVAFFNQSLPAFATTVLVPARTQ
jgi:hypothetical protein